MLRVRTPGSALFAAVANVTALAGDAAVVATATGALTTQIALAGAAQAEATATGDLTNVGAIDLEGAALAEATATGALTTAIALAGDALVEASGTGILDVFVLPPPAPTAGRARLRGPAWSGPSVVEQQLEQDENELIEILAALAAAGVLDGVTRLPGAGRRV
jgi:hypothetical protein